MNLLDKVLQAPTGAPVQPRASGGPRILVAVSEDATRRLIELLLKDWGYEAVLALDGNEALRMLRERDAPRLALLDWILPGTSGIEICQALRSETRSPSTYTLLLTSRGEAANPVPAIEAGADDFLFTPFDPVELQARLLRGKRVLNPGEHLPAPAASKKQEGLRSPVSVVGGGVSEAEQVACDPSDNSTALGQDMQMPGMKGCELAEQIERLRPGIPILLVSGYPGDFGRDQKDMKSTHLLLQKPFSRRDLERMLGKLTPKNHDSVEK